MVTLTPLLSFAMREELEDADLRMLTQELQFTIVPVRVVCVCVELLLPEEEPPVIVVPPTLMPEPSTTGFGAASAEPATPSSVSAASTSASTFFVLMFCNLPFFTSRRLPRYLASPVCSFVFAVASSRPNENASSGILLPVCLLLPLLPRFFASSTTAFAMECG